MLDEDRPLLTVEVDRGSNTIYVEARSVSEIGFHLNDALLDLDREFRIVVGGRELVIPKLRRDLLRLQRGLSRAYDPAALYPAYYGFELPR